MTGCLARLYITFPQSITDLYQLKIYATLSVEVSFRINFSSYSTPNIASEEFIMSMTKMIFKWKSFPYLYSFPDETYPIMMIRAFLFWLLEWKTLFFFQKFFFLVKVILLKTLVSLRISFALSIFRPVLPNLVVSSSCVCLSYSFYDIDIHKRKNFILFFFRQILK